MTHFIYPIRYLLLIGKVSYSTCKLLFLEKFDASIDEWIIDENDFHTQEPLGRWEYSTPESTRGDGSARMNGIKAVDRGKRHRAFRKFKNLHISKENPFFIVQFQLSHDQQVLCSGSYLKLGLLPESSPDIQIEKVPSIIFGPNICDLDGIIRAEFVQDGVSYIKKHEIPYIQEPYRPVVFRIVFTEDNRVEVYRDYRLMSLISLRNGWGYEGGSLTFDLNYLEIDIPVREAGIHFTNILITDDLEVADQMRSESAKIESLERNDSQMNGYHGRSLDGVADASMKLPPSEYYDDSDDDSDEDSDDNSSEL